LQSDTLARLLIDVLLHCRTQDHYLLHDFVIMPDHLHVLLSLGQDVPVEKAAQFIKGGFSYRAKRHLGYASSIWHRGFSEVRIYVEKAYYYTHRNYIHPNPVKAGLVASPKEWEFGSGPGRYETRCLSRLSQGLKSPVFLV
jgi:putative transposase